MTDECPNCNQPLTYDHYMDSMKCLFCNYRHNIAMPTHIEDDDNDPSLITHDNRYELDNWETNNMEYSDDDDVDYGTYVEE